jgi:phosphoribosylaminoimidazole-succinocarboxamide synthase
MDLDYDGYFLAQDVLFTADDDYERVFDIFYEHIKNAHLIRLTSRVHLSENKKHQFIMYRKQDGTDYVKFNIYKIEIIYRNYTISYDFINDPRKGAAFYGDDYRYFNLYNQSLDSFLINVNAEMRMIANNLSKNDDPLIKGQVFAIEYCLKSKDFRRFFN